jgi:flavin reductase (DIM6/NTAB) family NADH-FMN oxidoreductase RutF
MVGSIVPRPIAFVSTQSESGEGNLAPFSFFNGVSSNPPCLMFSVTKKPDGSIKDTLRNILQIKQFVVNTVSEWMAEPMNHCSGEFPYGVNEMEKAGLTPIPSKFVKPPRCKEAAVQFECELERVVEVGDGLGSGTIVVGRIVLIHIHPKVYSQGHVLIDQLQPISRLAGNSYGRVNEIFDIKRPKI